ncbi:MAG: PQQ-dependent sugar dehydrogenase, partial [Flavobacteriaceae bacterium]|nr:PQQ-dependent sugar dehydrogenase [Flavobacteriaceae bacterium]
SIPTDNPFYNTKGAKKAIFSYGHRNPQGMAIHPETGKIWVHEHGPKGGDEINIIKAGKNYGWPKITYGINYNGTTITNNTSLPKMEQPLHYWVPSIAPSGMAFVTSDKYPTWKGNVLVGSLKFKYLNRVVIENNKVVKEEKLLENMGRVRTVRQAPDGYIYVAIEQLGIVRIVPE